MARRDDAPLGAPCWIDLFTSDLDAARRFYEELFGWTSESAGEDFGGYVNFSLDGVRVAGAMHNDGSAGTPDVWSVYLAVADAGATVEAAVAAGGQVIFGPDQVGDLGRLGLLVDPAGAAIGIWEPGAHRGFGVLAEANAPSWFELMTRDFAAAIPFYEQVFGWDVHSISDTDEFRYSTAGEEETATAGVMDASGFLPDGVPSHWGMYVQVPDADASLAKALELGATVIQGPDDTPYGRLVALADPTGAMFKLQGIDPEG